MLSPELGGHMKRREFITFVGSAAAGGRSPRAQQAARMRRIDTRRNWPRSRRTSSGPMAPDQWRRCCRRPGVEIAGPCRFLCRMMVSRDLGKFRRTT
jgi:hypothetical protein